MALAASAATAKELEEAKKKAEKEKNKAHRAQPQGMATQSNKPIQRTGLYSRHDEQSRNTLQRIR